MSTLNVPLVGLTVTHIMSGRATQFPSPASYSGAPGHLPGRVSKVSP